MREMFAEHDLDQSGVLHESNIQAYFSDLNVILTDEDVETVMEDIDIGDADGEGVSDANATHTFDGGF